MGSLYYFIIVIVSYAIFSTIFMIYNIIEPKKYFGYISLSHIIGIFTTVATLYREVYGSSLAKGLSVIFFLSCHFIIYIGLLEFMEKKIKKSYIITMVIVMIMDLIAIYDFNMVSVMIHKVLLMSIYIYIGNKFMKHTNTISKRVFGIVAISLSSFQIVYFIVSLFVDLQRFKVDLVAYLLQSFILSLLLIAISIEESRKNMDIRLMDLKNQVENKKMMLEEAYEVDKLKNEFIVNISHELRTPINVLYSSIQLIEHTDIKNNEESVKNYLSSMKVNVRRLIKLINNFIYISAIDTGYMKLKMGNYDIVEFIESLTLSTVDTANEKNIELIFDTDFEEHMIAFDSEKIERIMLNLLSNAFKYTKAGGHIEVVLSEEDQYVVISVKDDGEGIPKDMQGKIFDRFVRGTTSLVRENEGSGIGLSLVKELVDMHDGKILLESKVGEGSTFRVYLPNKEKTDLSINSVESLVNSENKDIEFSDLL
ncbi:HAMP domain-containing histidine kinase [Clostridium sp. YIM B02505]|uniref:histidine kinase n=1 Tax=Clostridium yunnanense TaxID=2800325 RepID=A0ABS1EX47_9CLOT|nr:HAMP domain-containing sensor histidine kinase [Clostridium yunnanense]MBK1813928.1 HAMP domain-containing histidine kinase [Clostridium yunnanense]